MWLCVVGSVTRLMKIQISWMKCGFRMKLVFFSLNMLTQRITTSGAQPHLKIVGKVQYIPSSVKHRLPSRSMEGSDYIGSSMRTKSLMVNIARYLGYFGRFEQRWADQEELTEMNNASFKKEPLSYLI